MSHSFKYKNTIINYNSDYSGDATITVIDKDGPQTSTVPACALAAFATCVVGRQLESFLEGLPEPGESRWVVKEVCFSGTDHLGYVTAKTEDEAYEKALEKFGKRTDTDGTTSLAVQRG